MTANPATSTKAAAVIKPATQAQAEATTDATAEATAAAVASEAAMPSIPVQVSADGSTTAAQPKSTTAAAALPQASPTDAVAAAGRSGFPIAANTGVVADQATLADSKLNGAATPTVTNWNSNGPSQQGVHAEFQHSSADAESITPSTTSVGLQQPVTGQAASSPCTAAANGAAPDVNGPVSAMDNPAPSVDNPAPVVDNLASAVDGPAPAVENLASAVDGPAPAVSGPAATDGGSAEHGGAPSGSGFVFDAAAVARLTSVLRQYEGTHNFHNFTVRLEATDPSAKRYMLSCKCDGVFQIQVQMPPLVLRAPTDGRMLSCQEGHLNKLAE